MFIFSTFCSDPLQSLLLLSLAASSLIFISVRSALFVSASGYAFCGTFNVKKILMVRSRHNRRLCNFVQTHNPSWSCMNDRPGFEKLKKKTASASQTQDKSFPNWEVSMSDGLFTTGVLKFIIVQFDGLVFNGYSYASLSGGN